MTCFRHHDILTKKPLQDDDAFFAKMTLVHARSFALRKSRPRRLSNRLVRGR